MAMTGNRFRPRLAMTPEIRLLLACMRLDATPERAAEINALAQAVTDWPGLLRSASRDGLTCLLWHSLRRADCGGMVPDSAKVDLLDDVRGRAAVSLQQAALTAMALKVLSGSGIEVLLLKGVALAALVYPDPTLRAMADVDLLLHESDLVRAVALLGRAGFRIPEPYLGREVFYAGHHHVAPMAKGALRLELHRHVLPPPWGSPIEVGELWARAMPCAIEGIAVRSLAVEDLIIHVAAHAAIEAPTHHALRPLCDIAAIAGRCGSEIDWSAMVERCRRWNLQRPVYLLLAATESLLPGTIPAMALDALRPAELPRARPAYAELILADDGNLPAGIAKTMAATTGRSGLAEALRHVFPAPAVMRRCYGLAPGGLSLPLYYLYRPFDLLARYGAVVAGLAFAIRSTPAAVARQRARAELKRWVEDGRAPPPPSPAPGASGP